MEKIVGHERVIAFLERTAEEVRPAHAYLFTGREGVGKKKVAVTFACMLNCPDPKADPDRTCHVCRRIVAGNHPDFTLETPERGIIRIDTIRGLQNFFRYAPVEGQYRVIVIDDAHKMNLAAQNALLKTLEEPPPRRILILVTARPYALLATVRSRCRRVRFGPIPFEGLVEVLARDRGVPRERAEALAAMSYGSMSRSLEMDATSFLELREKVVSALEDPGAGGVGGLMELSASISGDSKGALDAIEIAATWIRDLLVTKIVDDTSLLIHRDSLDRISFTAQHHREEELLYAYGELVRASELIESDINVNRNLVTDVMLLRIARTLAGPGLGVVQTG